MNRSHLCFAILLAFVACSCRKLAPLSFDSPSGSATSAPAPPEPAPSPPVAAAPPAPTPIAPLTDGARIEDERNTIAVFRDSAPSVAFVTQTRMVVDYLQGTAQEVPAGSGSGLVS